MAPAMLNHLHGSCSIGRRCKQHVAQSGHMLQLPENAAAAVNCNCKYLSGTLGQFDKHMIDFLMNHHLNFGLLHLQLTWPA